MKPENFLSNPKERCFYCKRELFSKLNTIAKKNSLSCVLDGSNYDDKSDFRPGEKAAKEFGVRSPLREASFTKNDIRELSKELGLPTWDKPSYACLASRIPYGTRITKELLKKIDEGEKFLRGLGLKTLRVRHHGHIARIEVGKDEIPQIFDDGMMDKISKKFEDLGYIYVTLDLKGFRSGSMNEVLGGINFEQ
ncbi:MAG: ATP-dependent sacrificial sulfur transferase LarE [Candidatus Saganbacteria bacterium]|nr:ATP-dependent sacrificial sulfur transferase LarE [Candidatus Saganbacteria bacterium]